ncbi:hypothetical protein TDB9533_03282 [Thalassocella blandensis]|nr:hypothetical protein TDB9533_03282 [Thalassocella blandensis]
MKNLQKFGIGFGSILSVLTFTGCGESPQDDTDYADDAAYQDSYDEGYDDEAPNPSEDGWRKGMLQVQFTLKQGASFVNEEVNPQTGGVKKKTKINWHYELQASAEQNVWVMEDLSIIMPDGSEETRFEFLSSSPYFSEEEPKVSGTLAYQLHHSVDSPLAVDYISMEKDITGEAKVEKLDVEQLVPSLFGAGYELDMVLGFEYTQKGQTVFVSKNGTKSTLDESGGDWLNHKFIFYPVPNEDGLNDYPYLFEYEDAGQETRDAVTQHKLETLNNLKNIAAGNVDFIMQQHVGAVTEQSKDRLTMTYTFEGKKLLPFLPNIDSLGATPDSNELTIQLTLQAQ